MILGMGTDIVEISRIRKTFERQGKPFLDRVFTGTELKEASKKSNKEEFLSGRWAVKEAFSKALGCGISASCNWKDINTVNNKKGAPRVSISGKAKETAARKGVKKIHVSISHEKHYACATVILED